MLKEKIFSWKRTWRKLRFYLPHPSFFLMASLLLVSFAHIDRSSSVAPLSSAEILKTSLTETQKFSIAKETNTVLPNLAWEFFTPSWESKSLWSFSPTALPGDPVTSLSWNAEGITTDPEDRIEDVFKVPAELKDRVVFWMNVYGRFPSHVRIVHDRGDLSIIYGYIDLRPIFRTYGPTEVAMRKAANTEKKVLSELKAKILEAVATASEGKRNLIPSKERTALREIVSRAGALSKQDTLQLVERIRTQTGQRDMFLAALQRARHLLPHIESVFKRNGLPAGLASIPFVESSFNSNALSKIGALGIWQFTPETAKEFIHPEEASLWADPLKQTQSAARLLRSYRSALPDWGTAITSYNSGIGRVRRLVEKHRAAGVVDLIKKPVEGLGFAGKNFYSEFLAAHFVERYRDEIFGTEAASYDSLLVFKGKAVFPSQRCDL